MSSFIRSRIFISFILLSAVAWPVAQQAKAQGAQGTQGFQGQRGPQIRQGPWNETPKGDFWVEPLKEEPAGTHYKLFATPSRGPKTEASYLIYFPPGYEQAATRRYPVLYWLHEGNGNQLNGAPMVARIDKEILAGKIPPFIVVLVQGLPSVRYINAKDGKRPVEDVIVKDLIPHIDATYRTVASREGRAIEGMSMGGYGALRLGFKYPELFGTVSALAPSVTEMKDEPPVVTEPYGDDQAYYDTVDPRTLVKQNAAAIRGRTNIRLLVGGEDGLARPLKAYSDLLDSLKIDHQFVIAPGAHHMWGEIFNRLPFDALQFWKTAFAKAQ